MKLRDFRIGWRMLVLEPGYSSVVVLGLAVGFAVCFLLLGFVRYSFSYDSKVPDAQRIYLVKHKLNIISKPSWYESTPLPFLDVARRSGLVEAATAVMPLPVSVKADGKVQRLELTAVDPDFARMLDLHAIDGDLQAALSRPETLALTQSTSRQLFGSTTVTGQTVEIAGRSFRVAALLPDPPANSTVSYNILAGVNTAAWPEEQRSALFQAWGNIGAKLYVKLKPGTPPAALQGLLQDAADNSPLLRQLPPEVLQKLGQKKVMEIRLGALPDMYLDSDTANTPLSGPHGDLRTLVGLSAVALLILLLAVCNYVNLATMRTLRRQGEIAVRKMLGASVHRLVAQFLAEALLVALVSTGIGLLLAKLLTPLFASLVGFKLGSVFTLDTLGAAIVIGSLVGLAAGAYPAWVAQRVRPAQTLAGRGSSETLSGLWLRRVLSVVQIAAAIALTGVTLAIAWQTRYASEANPGFDTSSLLVLELPVDLSNPAATGLRSALERLPGVTGVAAAQDPIGRTFIGMNLDVSRLNGRRASVLLRPVSLNFFQVYGLRPLVGRMFDPKTDQQDQLNVIVINTAAAHALGFASPDAAIGQVLTTGTGPGSRSARIVGVAPDIRHESLRDVTRPLLYYPDLGTPTLTVRTTGGLGDLEQAADRLQRQYFPNDVVIVRRAHSYFAENYAQDQRLAKLLSYASLIAIAIAAFGIYVLSAYNVRRLAKQIVLRKLYGANRRAIARLIAREFATLLFVSALIGLPLATVSTERYLSNFVERAPFGVWPLVAAIMVALLVTLGSTLQHAIVAMRLAPARVLRD